MIEDGAIPIVIIRWVMMETEGEDPGHRGCWKAYRSRVLHLSGPCSWRYRRQYQEIRRRWTTTS